MKRFWTVFLLLILQGVGFGQTWVSDNPNAKGDYYFFRIGDTDLQEKINRYVHVELDSGRFYFMSNAGIKIPSGHKLTGMGYKTVLDGTGLNADEQLIEVVGTPGDMKEGVLISGLRLVGDSGMGDGIKVEYARDCMFKNVWIDSTGEEGFRIVFSEDIHVNNISIMRWYSNAAFQLTETKRIQVNQLNIRNALSNGTINVGIHIESSGINNIISNYVVINPGHYGVHIKDERSFGVIDTTTQNIFANGYIAGADSFGIFFDYGTPGVGATYTIFDGLIIDSIGTETGDFGINFKPGAHHNTIKNATITNCAGYGIQTNNADYNTFVNLRVGLNGSGGINIYQSEGISILGGFWFQNKGNGIRIAESSHNLVIGATIFNNNSDASGNGYGLELRDASKKNSILSNKILDKQSTITQTKCVRISANSDSNYVAHNFMQGAVSGSALSDEASTTFLSENLVDFTWITHP